MHPPGADILAVVNTVSLLPLTPDTRSKDPPTRRTGSTHQFSPHFFLGPENGLLEVVWRALEREPANYSPVVLQGPRGTGKTHFVGGLAARYRQQHPRRRVIFCDGGDFTRADASAVELDSLAEFRTKFREADFFVLDRLEQLVHRTASQLELLHTLDGLHARQRLGAAHHPFRSLGLGDPSTSASEAG